MVQRECSSAVGMITQKREDIDIGFKKKDVNEGNILFLIQ